MAFDPPTFRAMAGDTITWVTRDPVPHTVTAADGAWDSGELLRGESFTTVLTETGSVAYSCRYHPLMTATIEPITTNAPITRAA